MTDPARPPHATTAPASAAPGSTPGAPPARPAIGGVVPPLVTPLEVDGGVDHGSLRRLVDRLVEAGVHGVFALGSSAESVFMTDDRRREVLDSVLDHVAGRLPVYAGVIDTQTARVAAHVRHAEAAGAAAVVATAPFYAITGPEEIERHFRTLAELTALPLLAYDIPVCTHVKLAPEQLIRLGLDGVLAGVKDSSGDDVAFRRLAAMNRSAGSPMVLLTGHEVVVDGAYLAGADGCMPGLGNVDPAGYVRMWQAYRAGDWERVRSEQDRLAALFEIVFAPRGKVGPAAGIGAFKTALMLQGVIATNQMSPPMSALAQAEVDAVGEVLRRVGSAS